MVTIVRAMATVRRVMEYFNGNMFSLHYVSRNEKTWKMKRNIYYSSACELRRNNLTKENCRRTNVFVNRVFFALNFAGKLVQLSVSVLLSSLIYEHLLSHGYLKVGIRTSREWIPFLCYCWPWLLGVTGSEQNGRVVNVAIKWHLMRAGTATSILLAS